VVGGDIDRGGDSSPARAHDSGNQVRRARPTKVARRGSKARSRSRAIVAKLQPILTAEQYVSYKVESRHRRSRVSRRALSGGGAGRHDGRLRAGRHTPVGGPGRGRTGGSGRRVAATACFTGAAPSRTMPRPMSAPDGVLIEQFSNGFTLLAGAIPGTRSASFSCPRPRRAATDPAGEEGASAVLEGLVYRGRGRGTTGRSSDALDALGIERRRGRARGRPRCPRAHGAGEEPGGALSLYRDIILDPRLPEGELDAERTLALEALESLEDRPMEKVFVELRRAYLGPVFGRSDYGTKEGIGGSRSISCELSPMPLVATGRSALTCVGGCFDWTALKRDLVSPCSTPLEGGGCSLDREGRPCRAGRGMSMSGKTPPRSRLPSCTRLSRFPTRITTRTYMSHRVLIRPHGRSRGLFYSKSGRSGGSSTRCTRGAAPSWTGAGAVLRGHDTRAQPGETLAVLLRRALRIREGVTPAEMDRARTGLLSALVMREESARRPGVGSGRGLALDGPGEDAPRDPRGGGTGDGVLVREALERTPPKDFFVVTMGPDDIGYRRRFRHDDPAGFQMERLSNGLVILGERSARAQSLAAGFFVRTGSRTRRPRSPV